MNVFVLKSHFRYLPVTLKHFTVAVGQPDDGWPQ